MDHEGFHYKLNKTRDGKRYYVCATNNVYCKGTAVQTADGIIRINKPHTHNAFDNNFQDQDAKRKLRNRLGERARVETTALRVIYDEELANDESAALLYSWLSAESTMRQARRQTLPPLPSTIRELGEYLDSNVDRFQCNNSSFYQEWLVDSDGKYNIMFACHELISAVVWQGTTDLHADATFKVVPSMPQCRQLFIIHLILQNHSIPVCYVLMESKTEAAYKKVVERFHAKFPEVRPLTIMIDYESALLKVFSQIYPEAQINSCWFHYVQALQKNIKKMGYVEQLKQSIEAKKCFKMCAALALLPANRVEEGFQEVKNHAANNNVLLPRFFRYFTSYWLTRKGAECFSVHGQPRRTNNNVESFHSTLKQTFQVTHPNLWKMLGISSDKLIIVKNCEIDDDLDSSSSKFIIYINC